MYLIALLKVLFCLQPPNERLPQMLDLILTMNRIGYACEGRFLRNRQRIMQNLAGDGGGAKCHGTNILVTLFHGTSPFFILTIHGTQTF